MTSIKKMNSSLFRAAYHLIEAGKHLSNAEEFREESLELLKMADEMLAVIVPETPKISEEKMKGIMDEIMEFGEDEDGSS